MNSRFAFSLVTLNLLALNGAVIAQVNQLEIGVGYNSEDRFRPGQFSGQPESGGFVLGGFRLQSPLEGASPGHWQIEGRNLGLDTASLSAAYGSWGKYSFGLQYDQIPQAEADRAYTPFLGSGGSNQTLPATWVGASSTSGLTQLGESLRAVTIDKRRERLTGTAKWQFSDAWQLSADYRHEIKQGTDSYGAVMGSTGGNPRAALLRRPIDFETDELSLGIDQSAGASQYGVAFTVLRFQNQTTRLRWENPFNNSQWIAGAGYDSGAVGQLALEPDNTSRQWNLYAGHSFTGGTRVTASVQQATLEQDEQFLPYSSVVNAAVPLPRESLRGRIETLNANLALSTRLSQRSSLHARYQYRDRDNQTRQAIYQRVAGDVAAQSGLISDGARVNRIYDLVTERWTVDTDYRFSGSVRATLGFEALGKDYSMLDAEATDEQTGFIKLNFSPFSLSQAWVKFSHATRDSQDYNGSRPLLTGHNPDFIATLVGDELLANDPYLRRYHIADRDRDELSGNLALYPSASVGVNLLARLSTNDYPDSLVGVQESDNRSIAVDLTYAPAPAWSANLYYSFENYKNRQDGYARSGGGNPTAFYPLSVRDASRNWQVDSEDRVHTLGGGADWQLLGERLKLSLDASYSDALTESDPGSPGLSWLPLADVTTQVGNLSLKGTYQLAPGRELRLGYYFEDYDSEDFALDQVMVDTLSNVLLLGNPSPNYQGSWLELSLVIRL